jgi:drug/metabolite transporter (DMT)-like permease
LLWTTVANAVFIIGSAPLFTALVAWLVLREKVHPIGIVAMTVALAGLALMFADGFVTGRWIGNFLALGVVASFVLMLVILRYSRSIDMLPATCLAGVVAGAIAFVMADDLIISGHDLILCLILGSVQFGAGFMLLTISTRYIPAAEVALYSLTEAVLAPIWVWIGVDETPSLLTLSGGAIVLTAVLVNGLITLRRERRNAHAAQ